MTDDEINRKVAEIEGWEQVGNREAGRRWMPPGTPPEFNIFALYDCPPPYTTDWTWCGPLIEKYLVCMTHRGERWYTDTYDGPDANDDTPQRAICLAVIAAHDQPITSGHWTGLGDK
jgi:hypothetical protein